MSLRDRTKKRLRWFIAGMLVLGCAGAVAYVLRDRFQERTARASREAGLKFLEQGDYFHALHSIGPYVHRHPDDVETLFAYAKARQQVPEPNNRHLTDTLSLLRRVVTLKPGYTEATESLIDLYRRCGWNTEAFQLSQDLLTSDPSNRVAMKAKAFALARGVKGAEVKQGEVEKAVTAYSERYPSDIEGQLLTLDFMQRGDAARTRVVKYFSTLRDKSPSDPILTLLVGVAHLSAGNTAPASLELGKLEKQDMPDPAALQLLVTSCDAAGMFSQSVTILERHAKRTDQAFVGLLAGRLWELRKYQELVDRVDGKVSQDAQSAALRCLALKELERAAGAKDALELMKSSASSNASSRDWVALLEPLLVASPDDASIIRACEQLLRTGDNPYVRLVMGDAQLRTGEVDAALIQWKLAQFRAPAWVAPPLRLAQLALAAGEVESARVAAEAARARSPKDREVLTTLAAATVACVKARPDTAPKALAVLDEIAKDFPNEPTLAPLQVRMLAASGKRNEAVGEIKRLLAVPAPATQPANASTLLQLAWVSHEFKLGLEQELLARQEQTRGASAQLALLRAEMEISAGRKVEALQLFEKYRGSTTEKKLEWDTAWARLLEAVADPRANTAWISLADANGDNAQVQWGAISAPSTQGEREFQRRALDRLKGRFGDRGLRWRVEQSKWLLRGRDQTAAAEAALILNDLTKEAPSVLEAKLLLADAHHLLGQTSNEIEQLASAAAMQPDSSRIALRLADLLQARGESERARLQINRVLESPKTPPNDIRLAAELLEAQGDFSAALAALERAYGEQLNAPPRDVRLARLYQITNQPKKADAICARLSNDPEAKVDELAFVADFYTSQGRHSDAAAAVKRLESAPAEVGQKEILLGAYALKVQDATRAIGHFTAATKAAPSNPLGWRQLVRVRLMEKNDAAALSTARLAQSALPKDAGFAAFVRQSAQLTALVERWPELRGLCNEVLDSPDFEKSFVELVTVLQNGKALAQNKQSLNKVLALAENSPRVMPLQALAARVMLGAGRSDDAAKIALRSVRAQPRSASAAQFAAMMLATVGRWSDVLETARTWREAGGDALAIDQLTAVAYSALGNPKAARDRLTPYIQNAQTDPDKNRALIVQYARLEAVAASPDAAAKVLRPYLPKSAEWRVEWMRIAAMILDPPHAVGWLDEAERQSQKADAAERLALTESWQALATRSGEKAHRDRVAARLAAQADDPATSAEALLSMGCLAEAQDDMVLAEKYYRRSLQLNSQLNITQNNLAMLLARKGERLDEALGLAQKAVDTAVENRASFYDTLCFVQAKMADNEAALRSIRAAVELDPRNLVFRIRLATVMADGGRPEEAMNELRVIDQQDTRGVPTETGKQLQALRQRLSKAS